jgi:CRISPR-associated protein Csb1
VSAEKVKGEKLSEIGHGNIAPNPAHGGVTITSATRMATVSLAGLDRIGFGPRVEGSAAVAAVAARAVLAAYALLADRLAFAGPSLWLRSGCDLVTVGDRLEWVNRGGGVEPFELDPGAAVRLFELATRRAAQAGLAMSTETVVLTPTTELAKAIDFSLSKAEGSEGER